MRQAKKVKKSSKAKVVSEPTVSQPTAPYFEFKGLLYRGEHALDFVDKKVIYVRSSAGFPHQMPANSEVFFLQNETDKYFPAQHTLKKWFNHFYSQPKVFVDATNCILTLAHPTVDRPVKTFFNPRRNKMDGMSLSALVLRAHGFVPDHSYYEASHLCGHSRCINVDHLVWERCDNNARRRCCHAQHIPCTCTPSCVPYNEGVADILQDLLRLHRDKKRRT